MEHLDRKVRKDLLGRKDRPALEVSAVLMEQKVIEGNEASAGKEAKEAKEGLPVEMVKEGRKDQLV